MSNFYLKGNSFGEGWHVATSSSLGGGFLTSEMRLPLWGSDSKAVTLSTLYSGVDGGVLFCSFINDTFH